MNKLPKQGSKWRGNDRDVFHVIQTVELEGHTWVHYIKENAKNPQEYSCYLESFLQRFNEILE
jgi:hypothetical protein